MNKLYGYYLLKKLDFLEKKQKKITCKKNRILEKIQSYVADQFKGLFSTE